MIKIGTFVSGITRDQLVIKDPNLKAGPVFNVINTFKQKKKASNAWFEAVAAIINEMEEKSKVPGQDVNIIRGSLGPSVSNVVEAMRKNKNDFKNDEIHTAAIRILMKMVEDELISMYRERNSSGLALVADKGIEPTSDPDLFFDIV